MVHVVAKQQEYAGNAGRRTFDNGSKTKTYMSYTPYTIKTMYFVCVCVLIESTRPVLS